MNLKEEVAKMLFTRACGPEFPRTWDDLTDNDEDDRIRHYFYSAAEGVIPIIRKHTLDHLEDASRKCFECGEPLVPVCLKCL